jgi:hypothetical protein
MRSNSQLHNQLMSVYCLPRVYCLVHVVTCKSTMATFDESLVRAVEKRESLYNMRHKDYKNNNLRLNLWHDIATEVNCEGKYDFDLNIH